MIRVLVIVALVLSLFVVEAIAQSPQPPLTPEQRAAQMEKERRALDMYVAAMREQRHQEELDKFRTYAAAEMEIKGIRAELAAAKVEIESLRKTLKEYEAKAAAAPKSESVSQP